MTRSLLSIRRGVRLPLPYHFYHYRTGWADSDAFSAHQALAVDDLALVLLDIVHHRNLARALFFAPAAGGACCAVDHGDQPRVPGADGTQPAHRAAQPTGAGPAPAPRAAFPWWPSSRRTCNGH